MALKVEFFLMHITIHITWLLFPATQCQDPLYINSISQMAQQKLPHRSDEVVGKVSQFITAFSLFGNCHNIFDRNFIDEAHAQALVKVSNDFCVIRL